MRYIQLVSYLLLLFTEYSSAQWFVQNSLPERGPLCDVSFTDANNGIIVGMGGVILRTTNGGEEWLSQSSGTQINLNSAALTNILNGVAVGDSGIILRTEDGGNNWTEVQSGTTSILRDICFADDQNGWVVGGQRYENNVILKSTNGGATWITQSCASTQFLYSLSFTDINTGIAVGDSGAIVKTTNGGENWIEVESGTIYPLRDICFVDNNNGWAVGGNYTDGHIILNTVDGGDTWEILPDTIPQQYNFIGVAFSNPYNGIIVGGADGGWTMIDTYIILETDDGGLTWAKQKSGIGEQFKGAFLSDSLNGTVVSSIGTILKTTDGGDSWYTKGGTKKYLYDVCFTDINNGTIVGEDGTIFNTSDGGKNWNESMIPTSYFFPKVCFINENIGWVIGNKFYFESVILKTTNAGIEWIEQYRGENHLQDIFFIDKNTGVVATSYDTILRTTDGGNSWMKQNCVTHPLNGIYFTDADNGTVVSNDGIIMRTTDGGENWTPQNSGTISNLYSVFFTDVNNGTVVGRNVILSTADGGTNWTKKTGSGYNDFLDVTFSDINNGTIVGTSGVILRTTDGGENWIGQISGTNKTLSGVSFIDASTGWAVGRSGLIIHTTNGGVTFIADDKIKKIPTKYSLFQNYPNPFNPATTIKYSIPELSLITIRIYDILGKEIENLVCEEKPAGTYELNWYAGNLPSGVYICRFQAGKFISNTKMLFLK